MKRLASASLSTLISVLLSGPAYGNPQGASVVHGSAVIDQATAGQLNITNSANAIINWQSFGINPGEITRFIQPSASSAVMNRVIGANPSQIMGQLQSNGRVFLINPNGILFGEQAVVDTAGLIASTLEMSNADFLMGKLDFSGGPDSGTIENKGYIKAGRNGEIFLIAPNIENSGVIESEGGRLLLAAGEKITITSLDADDIAFEIQAPENSVVNLGEMITNGGAASVFAGTIEHSGSINADGISVDAEGRIQLFAQSDITVTSSAQISASGPAGGSIHIESASGTTLVAGQVAATGDTAQGGSVQILGERVGLIETARVDVSGETGGGEVLIGGDFQGTNPDIKNAEFTYMGSDTRIQANARRSGDGGKVILWADDSTRAYGEISATGGSVSGDGGFIEISGKKGLVFEASVYATASNGENGTLLLDPDTIDIINGGGGSGDGGLPLFTAAGVTTISELSLEAQVLDVVLQATNGITLQDLADNNLNMSSLVNGESITLRVTGAGNISFADANDSITTAGGDIIIENTGGAGNLSNIGNLITTAGTAGDVSLSTVNGNIDLQGNLTLTGTTSGNASLIAGGTGMVSQNLATSVFNLGKLKVISGNGIDLQGNNLVQQFTGLVNNPGNISFNNTRFPGLTLAADGTTHAVETNNGNVSITSSNNLTAANSINVIGNATLKSDTAGNVNINAPLTATGTVQLEARGSSSGEGEVQQNVVGVITANLLDVIADQAVLLNFAVNQVNTFTSLSNGVLNSGTDFDNGTALLTLGTITDNGGDISISNNSNILIDFDVNAVSGNVDISAGNNIDGDGSTAKIIAAGDIDLTTIGASSGIGKTNKVITSTGADLSLTTGGTAGSGNITVEETSGPARFDTSALTISTDGGTQQVVDLTLPNGLNVDANLGVAGDDLSIHTPGRDIQAGLGTLTANDLILDSDTGIGGVTALKTSGGTIQATVASGGALNMDVTGNVTFTALSNNSAGDIKVNQTGGSGAVLISTPVNSGGQTRIRANNGLLTIDGNISSPGSVFLDTVGSGDVRINTARTVAATSVGSDVNVTSAANIDLDGSLQSAMQDVNITAASGQITMGGAANATAANNISLNGLLGVDIAALNAGSNVAIVSGTGSVTDTNGAANNITAGTVAAFNAPLGNVGTIADPLETAIPLVNFTANTGEIGIINNGNLQVPTATYNASKILIKTSSGDLTFSPAVMAGLASQVTLEAQNNLSLQAGLTANSALLNLSSVSGSFTLSGVTESVSAMDVQMAAPVINLNNGASITSLTNMTVNAGNLLLNGGAVAAATKLTAAGTMTFTGNDITLQGGTAANAIVSIDPTLVHISIAGDLNVIGGSGISAYAEIVGNDVQVMTPGSVNLIGGGPNSYAVIEALTGTVDINANNILLNQGGGLDADAVISTTSGLGNVILTSNTCSNCVLLPSDPFLNSMTEAGIFAANLTLNTATANTPGATTGEGSELPAVDEILVLDELFQSLEEEVTNEGGGESDDEDEDRKKQILVCS